MYMCMYVKANAYIRYVTLRYVTLHYMHSSMHTYISMYTLIHLYTCMYRGLLQAVHRERTVKKTHAWHKIYRNYLFSCDIKKPHSQKRKPTNKIRSFGLVWSQWPHNQEFIRLSIRFQWKAELSGIGSSRRMLAVLANQWIPGLDSASLIQLPSCENANDIVYITYAYTYIYIMWTEWSLFRMLSKVVSRAPNVCVSQRFNGCNGGAACFPWNGHLSQQCVGG